ncbi:MAG: hypothetical protein GX660_24680 [Clostridiaceae bacterium]|mgnify:CR=1 FL=1|nr:hypothetical protein [Clostridiaceae bacterium]
MFFKVVVACGHLGCRREVEITRYFQADNAIDAWESAMIMPRSKKGQKSRCVRQVYEIDIYEFMLGKLEELKNPYLQIKKKKARIA